MPKGWQRDLGVCFHIQKVMNIYASERKVVQDFKGALNEKEQ